MQCSLHGNYIPCSRCYSDQKREQEQEERSRRDMREFRERMGVNGHYLQATPANATTYCISGAIALVGIGWENPVLVTLGTLGLLASVVHAAYLKATRT